MSEKAEWTQQQRAVAMGFAVQDEDGIWHPDDTLLVNEIIRLRAVPAGPDASEALAWSDARGLALDIVTYEGLSTAAHGPPSRAGALRRILDRMMRVLPDNDEERAEVAAILSLAPEAHQ